MLPVIALFAAGILGAFLVFVASKPDSFRYERSIAINAAPEKIFPYLNDLRKGEAWSPWDKKDPAMKKTYSGAESGVGAVYEWDGNKEVGKGRMEIVESTPASKVVSKLHFITPFEAHNMNEYILTPKGDATEVTWAMYGPVPFMGKLMGVFMDCEKMVGKEFETGLATLKTITEK